MWHYTDRGLWHIQAWGCDGRVRFRGSERGYRLVDTAQIYGNEKAVGKAISKSGLPRDSVFVSSKLWRTQHGYARARAACLQSLKDLGLTYIDLMLIHWPDCKRGWPLKRGTVSPPDWTPSMRDDTWRALEDLHFFFDFVMVHNTH